MPSRRAARHRREKILLGAQQRVGLHVIGGVVAVVRVGLKNGIEIEQGDPHAPQIGQLALDARKIAAEIVQVEQAAVHLVGPEIGLAVLVGPVIAVRKGHLGLFDSLAEPVGEDLVHHAAAGAHGVRNSGSYTVSW